MRRDRHIACRHRETKNTFIGYGRTFTRFALLGDDNAFTIARDVPGIHTIADTVSDDEFDAQIMFAVGRNKGETK